jgi:signal transduction histidine kinase
VVVAAPVHGVAADGGAPPTLGVLTSTLSMESMQAFVDRFARVQGVDLTVTDQFGVVVVDPHRTNADAKPITSDPRVAAALDGKSGVREMTIGGTDIVSAYEPVAGTGWTISASMPTNEAFAAQAELRRFLLAAAAVLLITLLVVLYHFARALRANEEELEGTIAELRSTNRTLDTFSHTLAHDLRNPLTTIGGFAQVLQATLADADDQARQMMHRIEESAGRMDSLIQEVLDLAMATRAADDRAWLDPAEVTRDAATDVFGIVLELGKMPDEVCANHASLYRSLKNLFENASRYAVTEPGRPVRVRVSVDDAPLAWRFRVEDDGPGVAVHDRARIFEAFQRGEEGRVTGTGLGLSIVAAFAESHGGAASVEEAPGGGACFIIEIDKPARELLSRGVEAEERATAAVG